MLGFRKNQSESLPQFGTCSEDKSTLGPQGLLLFQAAETTSTFTIGLPTRIVTDYQSQKALLVISGGHTPTETSTSSTCPLNTNSLQAPINTDSSRMTSKNTAQWKKSSGLFSAATDLSYAVICASTDPTALKASL